MSQDQTTVSFPPGATVAEVRARYRALSKVMHPDAGGDGAGWRELTAAYAAALAEAEAAPCPACGGTGWETVRRGFHSLHSTCPACGGTGKREGG